MGKNYIITILLAIILAAIIDLTGCESINKMANPMPKPGPVMQTGDEVRPPQGYIDMINRTKPD